MQKYNTAEKKVVEDRKRMLLAGQIRVTCKAVPIQNAETCHHARTSDSTCVLPFDSVNDRCTTDKSGSSAVKLCPFKDIFDHPLPGQTGALAACDTDVTRRHSDLSCQGTN